MGLSAGGFFKNFVKGAAQQYNTNVAYVEQQKVEEEKAKAKEKRQFGYDSRLQKLKQDNAAALAKASGKDENKYLGRFNLRNGKGTLDIKMLNGFANLPDKKAKSRAVLNAFSIPMQDMEALKKQLTPNAYSNLIGEYISSYATLSTVKTGEGKDGGKVEISYNPEFYQFISERDDLKSAFALQLGQDAKWYENYTKNMNKNAILADNPNIKKDRFNQVTMSIDGFYGEEDTDGYFKKGDLSTVQNSLLRTGSKKEAIVWMNNKHEFMKAQEAEHKSRFNVSLPYTGSNLIQGIQVATAAINLRLEPSQIDRLSPVVGQTIRDAVIKEMGATGKAMVNDPQIFHQLIMNSLPRKVNPPIRQIDYQPVRTNTDTFLTRIFGDDKGKLILNSASKSQQSGDRFRRANEVIVLVDAGAGTGYAARIQAGTTGFAEQAKQLITRITGYKSGKNEFGETAKELTSSINTLSADIEAAPETVTAAQAKNGIKTKDQIANDALLRYTTTLMVFDIATMAQDAGGGLNAGGSAVRLSDGDVKLSAQALQQTLFENPRSLKIVAQKIAELAEKEKVIFEMISRGDVAEAGAALVMMDAYRGELGTLISAIKDPNDRGVSISGEEVKEKETINQNPQLDLTPENKKNLLKGKKKVTKKIIR